MNQDQQEMLIRVDQNVSNLVEIFKNHVEDDKAFQKVFWTQIEPLKADKSERKGIAKLAGIMYTCVITGLGALIGVKYGSR